jgi:hypothetical protein
MRPSAPTRLRRRTAGRLVSRRPARAPAPAAARPPELNRAHSGAASDQRVPADDHQRSPYRRVDHIVDRHGELAPDRTFTRPVNRPADRPDREPWPRA